MARTELLDGTLGDAFPGTLLRSIDRLLQFLEQLEDALLERVALVGPEALHQVRGLGARKGELPKPV